MPRYRKKRARGEQKKKNYFSMGIFVVISDKCASMIDVGIMRVNNEIMSENSSHLRNLIPPGILGDLMTPMMPEKSVLHYFPIFNKCLDYI